MSALTVEQFVDDVQREPSDEAADADEKSEVEPLDCCHAPSLAGDALRLQRATSRRPKRYISQPRHNPIDALSNAATRAKPVARAPNHVTPVR